MKTSDGQFEFNKPVNEIVIPESEIKAFDLNSPIKIELYNGDNKASVNDLASFSVSDDDDTYHRVEDFSVTNNVVTFKLPELQSGKYYPQIVDNKGQVYSSNNKAYIEVMYNRETRIKEIFPTIRKEVIDGVTPLVIEHLNENKEIYKGPKGDRGVAGPVGPKGPRGSQGFPGQRGPKGDIGPQGIPGAVDFDYITPEQIEMLKGEKGDKGDRGLQGPQGEQGPQGIPGAVDFDVLTPEQINMLKPDFELDEEGNLYYVIGEDVSDA